MFRWVDMVENTLIKHTDVEIMTCIVTPLLDHAALHQSCLVLSEQTKAEAW